MTGGPTRPAAAAARPRAAAWRAAHAAALRALAERVERDTIDPAELAGAHETLRVRAHQAALAPTAVLPAADVLLSVTEAAERLGLARLPNDVPRVRVNRKVVRVRASDLAQYLQNHVETGVHNLYSPLHDGIGTAAAAASAAPDPSRTRRDPRGDLQHGRSVGTGRGRHLTAGRPVGAPAAPAVPQPPSKGENVDGSDTEGS
jgi:hypothetical protein